MSQRYEHAGHVLEIDQQMIDVTSSSPRPAPWWAFIDAAGHEHAYVAEQGNHYPTLARKSGEPYWCDDCPGEHVDEWFECRLCGEKITPGTYVSSVREYAPGPLHASIDGEPVTREQAEAFLAQMQEARAAT